MTTLTGTKRAVVRHEVVQAFCDLFDSPRYLEVGVNQGRTFLEVKAKRKVAVDPRFAFDYRKAAKADAGSIYHEVTSDVYFGQLVELGEVFDVVYLDGLHTFEQIVRDLLNALFVTHAKSVIIIDDVLPSNYHSAIKDLSLSRLVMERMKLQDRSWMGDVYKVVPFIETYVQQLSYAIVEDNHGQLVAWRAKRPSVTEESLEAISRAPFESVFTHEAHTKRIPLAEIRSRVAKVVRGA